MAIQIRHGVGVLFETLQRQVAVLDITLQQPSLLQVAGHAVGNTVQEDLQLFCSGRCNLSEAQLPIVRLDIDADSAL